MAHLDVVRVFVGTDGSGGNELGIFLDGSAVPEERRQPTATRLGFSETVYVDDAATGLLRIFTPATELPFAGHPLVGTAWLLDRGRDRTTLRPPAGAVPTFQADGMTWIEGRPEWAPVKRVEELASPMRVDELSPDDCDTFDLYAWSWLDETRGIVRARYFAPGYGIAEDEATGSAAILLGSLVKRTLTIRQGVGSLLHVRPAPGGGVAVGGRVEALASRELTI